jgi:hypothetical protein
MPSLFIDLHNNNKKNNYDDMDDHTNISSVTIQKQENTLVFESNPLLKNFLLFFLLFKSNFES